MWQPTQRLQGTSEALWITVIGSYMVQLSESLSQNQEFCAPDGFIIRRFSTMGAQRHYWALMVRFELDEKLSPLLAVEGKQ